MEIFRVLGTSFFVGLLLYPVLIKLLTRLQIIDVPGGRKIHKGIIPSMGGIGFVVSTFFSVAIWLNHDSFLDIRLLLASFGLMFFVGLRDDLVNLTAWQKIGAQLVASYMVVVVADIRIIGFYGFLGVHDLPVIVSYFLSVFVILSLTNAFNLIDGLDGLAGSLSFIILIFYGVWYFLADMLPFAMFSFALVGGVLSFLVFNWHPAKIFMGDTGSLSLGFSIAVLTLLFIHTNATTELPHEGILFNAPIATCLAVLIIPVLDTSRVFVRRILQGKSPMAPDKSHIHHFLIRMGLKHHQVSIVLSFLTLLFIAMSLVARNATDNIMIPVLMLISLFLGYQLDTLTVKVIKKKTANTPPLLSLRKYRETKPITRPKIANEVFEKSSFRDN